jgi:hypothetical protein
MNYMLLIVEPPEQRRSRTLDEGREAYERMREFGRELQESGQLIATESLKSLADAARVEVREGRTKVLDGPFVEAKEMIGGFFLVDCKSREEAVSIAARCPAAQWCTVEVRELGPCYT